MGGTIIDQLTTKLGLDVSDFKKGIGEAKKQLGDLKNSSEQSGDALGGALGAGAKRASGNLGMLGSMLGKGGPIAIGIGATIYLGKKLDDTLFKVAMSVRQVSIESKNLNMAASNMRNLQNVSEMAGGSIEDVAQTVDGLQKSMFNLRFNGQVSEQIVMLSRLGVQFQDSYGRAREFNDVMLDTAEALEKAQSRGEMTRGEAFQFANQAGFTGGMAQIVLSGRSGAEAELARQRARTQISDKMVSGAERWVRGSTSLGQATEAELGLKGVDLLADKRGLADEKLEGAGKYVLEGVQGAVTSLGHAADAAGESLIGLAIKAGILAPVPGHYGTPRLPPVVGSYEATIQEAAKRHGVPPEVLTGLIRTESGFNSAAVNSKSGARGIAQFMPETAKEMGIVAGQDPAADIDAAARYLKKLQVQAKAITGEDEGDTMPWVMAAAAYNAGMGNVKSGKRIGPEAMAYPEKVMQGLPGYEDAAYQFRNSRPTQETQIQIDNINVNTQATDADGIASGIGGATRRKLLAAQAEGGIQ